MTRRMGWRRPRVAVLWIAALATTTAGGRALAGRGVPSASSPSLSTEGVVVFGCTSGASTDGTYRMAPDGTGAVRVTPRKFPCDVSRGSAPLTILIQSNLDIYAVRADGVGGEVPLLVSSENESQARFDPGASRIAYVTVSGGAPSPYAATIRTANVLRNATGDVTGVDAPEVVWSGSMAVSGLDFSRDGTQIVFAGNSDLYVLDLATGSVEQLTDTPALESSPRWSPTDDRIAFQRKDSAASAIASILTLDYGTGALRTVVAGDSRLHASLPCWSPGATHLLALVGGSKLSIDLYQFPSTGGRGVNVTGAFAPTPNYPCWGW